MPSVNLWLVLDRCKPRRTVQVHLTTKKNTSELQFDSHNYVFQSEKWDLKVLSGNGWLHANTWLQRHNSITPLQRKFFATDICSIIHSIMHIAKQTFTYVATNLSKGGKVQCEEEAESRENIKEVLVILCRTWSVQTLLPSLLMHHHIYIHS